MKEDDKMNVSIDKNQVSKIASSIISDTEDLKKEIDNLLNTIDKLNAVWQGPDANKYVTGLKEECILELNKYHDILQDYGTYLKNVPQGYDALDGIFSSKNIDKD